MSGADVGTEGYVSRLSAQLVVVGVLGKNHINGTVAVLGERHSDNQNATNHACSLPMRQKLWHVELRVWQPLRSLKYRLGDICLRFLGVFMKGVKYVSMFSI